MEIRVRKSREFPGDCSITYLLNTHRLDGIFRLYGTNKVIAVCGYVPEHVNIIRIVEEQKKPLYKQHMDMMMGKRPTNNIRTRAYQATRLSLEECEAYARVQVYDVI